MSQEQFELTCPMCGANHTKRTTRHCLPDRFDWCSDCDKPHKPTTSQFAQFRDVGLRVNRYGQIVLRPELGE